MTSPHLNSEQTLEPTLVAGQSRRFDAVAGTKLADRLGQVMANTSLGHLLVTLNYRLGVTGFFSHPELTTESAQHSSGNYGPLDQLAALDWVKQNIAPFGVIPTTSHCLVHPAAASTPHVC